MAMQKSFDKGVEIVNPKTETSCIIPTARFTHESRGYLSPVWIGIGICLVRNRNLLDPCYRSFWVPAHWHRKRKHPTSERKYGTWIMSSHATAADVRFSTDLFELNRGLKPYAKPPIEQTIVTRQSERSHTHGLKVCAGENPVSATPAEHAGICVRKLSRRLLSRLWTAGTSSGAPCSVWGFETPQGSA